MLVPVVDSNQMPLMPTTKHRAMRMVAKREATPFWKKGVWCIRLNKEPSGRVMQDICVGIDTGSKKEAMTVKSEAHTIINIQLDAITWVKDAIKTRREMRRGRRFRKTPYRANRMNRARGGIPPSTKARWQWKLRILNWLRKLYPITDVQVEDIKARTFKGKRKWNLSFSPLECGKLYFYNEVRKFADLYKKEGWETKELRDAHGLHKLKDKMSSDFHAHAVDSWVLANDIVGGHTAPEDKSVFEITPLQFSRRQLHRLQPAKGGERKPYGSTRSEGFKRGSIVRHIKYGVSFVGGASKGRISLHSLFTGKRLCQNAKVDDTKFLSFNSWRFSAPRFLPQPIPSGLGWGLHGVL